MVLLGAQRLLDVPPPRVEELLGRGIEAQERHLVRREVLGADPGRWNARGQHAVERQDYPGISASESTRNAACRAWCAGR